MLSKKFYTFNWLTKNIALKLYRAVLCIKVKKKIFTYILSDHKFHNSSRVVSNLGQLISVWLQEYFRHIS